MNRILAIISVCISLIGCQKEVQIQEEQEFGKLISYPEDIIAHNAKLSNPYFSYFLRDGDSYYFAYMDNDIEFKHKLPYHSFLNSDSSRTYYGIHDGFHFDHISQTVYFTTREEFYQYPVTAGSVTEKYFLQSFDLSTDTITWKREIDFSGVSHVNLTNYWDLPGVCDGKLIMIYMGGSTTDLYRFEPSSGQLIDSIQGSAYDWLETSEVRNDTLHLTRSSPWGYHRICDCSFNSISTQIFGEDILLESHGFFVDDQHLIYPGVTYGNGTKNMLAIYDFDSGLDTVLHEYEDLKYSIQKVLKMDNGNFALLGSIAPADGIGTTVFFNQNSLFIGEYDIANNRLISHKTYSFNNGFMLTDAHYMGGSTFSVIGRQGSLHESQKGHCRFTFTLK